MNVPLDLDTLIEQCRSADSKIKIVAMHALEKMDAPDAALAILPLLGSPDEVVRKVAAGALGQLGSHHLEQVGPALEALLADPEDIVRNAAAEGLGLLRYPPARQALEHALLHDKDWIVRASAAWALGELDDARALGALERALADEHEPVRGYAALAIGLLGDWSQRASIRSHLDAGVAPGNRAEFLVAAVRLGDDSAFDELLALADEADDDMTIEVQNAIQDMLSRKTPSLVLARAAELEPRLAKLGSGKLRARLDDLVTTIADE